MKNGLRHWGRNFLGYLEDYCLQRERRTKFTTWSCFCIIIHIQNLLLFSSKFLSTFAKCFSFTCSRNLGGRGQSSSTAFQVYKVCESPHSPISPASNIRMFHNLNSPVLQNNRHTNVWASTLPDVLAFPTAEWMRKRLLHGGRVRWAFYVREGALVALICSKQNKSLSSGKQILIFPSTYFRDGWIP